MSVPAPGDSIEDQIDQWRTYLRRRRAIHTVDVAELEDHLREQITALLQAGLSADEAFLVAVKRIGSLDALSREFAREHSDRLWKQLVVAPSDAPEPAQARTDALVVFSLAAGAAAAIKVPALFGIDQQGHAGFYFRNLSLFVLPFLTAYFAWKRRLAARTVAWLAGAFAAAAVAANVYPFTAEGSTESLTAIHLPIALWLIVGIAYSGGRWGQVEGRMDFIRFSGELFIYFVLIGLGGGVFTLFLAMIFNIIGVNAGPFIGAWIVPCGGTGALVVAAWLVEAKQSVVENMAPVLTRLFTPLFAVLLAVFLVTLLWTGRGINVERNVLIAFDALLAVVLGMLLYSISARDPLKPPNVFDGLQVALVIGALLTDAVALWAIAARISEFGFSPNRVAALGENVILLGNLAWSAALYIRFLRGRGPFNLLERWQTGYLPVYSVWGAGVALVFPPLFRYI